MPVVPQPLPVSAVSARVVEDGVVLAWSPPTVYDTEKALDFDDIKYFRIFRKLEAPLDNGWNFKQSNEGWTATGQSLALKQYNGVLRTGSRQEALTILSQEDLKLNAAKNRFIRLKLWTKNAQQAYLAFITDADKRWDKSVAQEFEPSVHSSYYAVHQAFNSSKLKRFPIRQSEAAVAQEYIIDMHSIPAWNGVIYQLGLILQNALPDEELVELGLDSVEFIQDFDSLAPAYQSAPWVFIDDEEGWRILPAKSLFSSTQGVLSVEENAAFSLLSAPGQRIRFDESSSLQVRMRVTAGDEAYLILRRGGEKIFRTAKELADAVSRGIRIPLKASPNFSTYTVDLKQYIELLDLNDADILKKADEEPETMQDLQTDEPLEEESPGSTRPGKRAYFTQIGLVFPAVAENTGKRQILIDYIDVLPDGGTDPDMNASVLAQRAIPAGEEISRELNLKIQDKRSAFELPYDVLPEEQEQTLQEKILLAEISPSEPSPAEFMGERFRLIDSGQFVVESEDGEERTATLEYGNRYSYEIEVMDRKKRKSEISETISIEFMRAPSPPRDLRAEAGDEQVTLIWRRPVLTEGGKKTRNLSAYRIFRSRSAGKYAEVPLGQIPASQTQFIDSSVKNRETYYYVVQALASQLRGTGSGEHSAEVSAMPLDTSAPETPGGLVGVYLDDKVNLHWNQVPTADFAGFNVYRSDSRDGNFQKLNDELLRKSSFTDAMAETKRRYYYYITALDDEVPPNESEPSEVEPIETYPLD